MSQIVSGSGKIVFLPAFPLKPNGTISVIATRRRKQHLTRLIHPSQRTREQIYPALHWDMDFIPGIIPLIFIMIQPGLIHYMLQMKSQIDFIFHSTMIFNTASGKAQV